MKIAIANNLYLQIYAYMYIKFNIIKYISIFFIQNVLFLLLQKTCRLQVHFIKIFFLLACKLLSKVYQLQFFSMY